MMRALIDTGTSVTLIRENQYKSLMVRGAVKNLTLRLAKPIEKKMTITGIVWLPVKIGRTICVYKLYVSLGLDGEVILGEEWLDQHRSQLNFNPAVLLVEGVEKCSQ